jgi:hypothetical protein
MKNTLALTLLITLNLAVKAQDCSQVYNFNINDKASYSTSCGYQDGSSWKVVKNSCNFYTPLTNVGGKSGGPKKWVDISIRLGNSGNMDEKDFAWIFYYINGKAQATKTIKGNEVEQLFNFRDSVAVPPGGTFKLRIAFVCDEQDEFWKLSNGDLTTCVRAVEGEAVIAGPVITGKITFVKEREVVKLMWYAPATTSGNYFRIERSKDGTDYEFAGFVKDKRETGSISQYSFVDGGCFKPETWYRITQIDLQGTVLPFGNPTMVKF